jgi:hypothetical protein
MAEPLTARERWMYGGMGAIAPLVVAAIAQDLATVFSNLTVVVGLGYLAKALLLFGLGGFVSFLQKTETEGWKSFLIGISAPALVTTAAANSARAEPLMPPVYESLAARVPIQSFDTLRETGIEQFLRGFFSWDPRITLLVIGEANTARDAQLWTVAGYGFVACNVARTEIAGGRIYTFEPLVIAKAPDRFTAVLISDSSPSSELVIRSKPLVQEVLVFNRSERSKFFFLLRETQFRPVLNEDLRSSIARTDRRCLEENFQRERPGR